MRLQASKIEDLLLQHRSPRSIPRSEYESQGLYPIIDQGVAAVGGFTNDAARVNHHYPCVVFGDHTCRLKYVDEPFCRGAEGAQLLYCDEKRIHPRFFFYLLKTVDLSSFGYARHYKYLRAKTVVFPKELSVQKKISDLLSKYDALIDNNIKRSQLLEQSMLTLFKEWFVYLRFPNHQHSVFVDGVPADWSSSRLIDLASITMGQSPKSQYYNSKGNGLPFHQGVSGFGFRFVRHATFCSKITRVAQKGDVLFSVRAPVGRLNVASETIVMGRGLSALRSRTGRNSFLFYLLKSHFYRENLIGHGAIFAAVTKKRLEEIRLMTPSAKLQDRFEDLAGAVDLQIWNLEQQNQRLSKMRDMLLHKLVNGNSSVFTCSEAGRCE